MTANSNPPDDSADALRARALQRAHEEDKASKQAKSVQPLRQAALAPGNDIELAHELRVHQIELEMQNQELRESKLALEITRARYFDLYELAPMGYLTVSEAGLILDCNLTAATMLGIPRGRLISRSFGQLLAKQDQDAWYFLRKKVAATDKQINAELRVLRGDGSQLWCMFGVANATDELGVTATRVVISDITERKQVEDTLRESESRYRTLVEHSPYCIHEIDLEGRFTAMNHAGLKMLGVNDVCFIQGMSCLDVVGDHDREQVTGLLASALAGQWSEFNFQAANGMALQSTFVPITDENGVVQRLMGLSIDITDRKLAEKTQNALLKDKVALLREVHHRVKNNLQVITSLLRLEASRSELSETQSVLTLMQGRIHAMAQLHETLYRSGTFAEIDLAAYLGTLCTQIFSAHLFRHDFVRLELDMASVQVNMDQATSCGLLLNELVSNCLKHAFPDDRPGEVSVSLQPLKVITQVHGALWRLRVQDTGVGLPGNFEERRDSSLGLQLVGDLSLQVGGELVIESEPGKGTVFTVDFEALLPAALAMP